ncbi:unnamed protein product [Cuscuta campestris]|uniref:Uncharacterized protein n=1 Tax=Cuscuta campestris TaxID=132261 RepID=A0A484MP19_9ASTE|nr:unnamed protein product [Cuscuta campestris]
MRLQRDAARVKALSKAATNATVSRRASSRGADFSNSVILELSQDITCNHLPRNTSDHNPLLIKLSNLHFAGPKPFRYINCWSTHNSFMSTVSNNWGPYVGGGMRGLGYKLKNLGHILHSWNKNTFGNIFNRDEIHEEILNYYNTLFMYKESHNDRFTANVPNLITQMDNSSLTSLPDENEVKEAVWSLSADSAAGPDGFNGHFYKTCWEQIKVDCTKAVQEFFLGIPIPKICTQTTIILIPKKENSQFCEDYRPICLSNFCCKIFSKILSQRLSSILPRLISPEQGGFVKGRVIHDQVLLTQELFHGLDYKSRGGRGTIKKETTSGALSPYYLGRHYTPITRLAFADDLILFTKGDSPTVTSIKLLLSDYEDCSGQQINRGKCSFYIPKKTPLATQRRIQTILGMNKGSLPFKYLGIQIHHGINRKPYCNDILNLFDTKLKGWYHKLLSQSGRLTLIKHVLNTMPLHMLGCSKLPKSIIKCLHSKMNNFLWGHDKDNKKYHLSSWEKLCLPKDEGGLGITDLNTLQLAYGFKMWWTYTQNNSLWANFMRARYPRGLSIAPKIIDSVYWKRLYEVNSMADNHLSIDTQGRILWHNGEEYQPWNPNLLDKLVETRCIAKAQQSTPQYHSRNHNP